MDGIKNINITKINDTERAIQTDQLAIEEPLEIIIAFSNNNNLIEKTISITMRTPGDDHFLSAGFLFTEGIITSPHSIINIRHKKDVLNNEDSNRILLQLNDDAQIDLKKLERHFYTTSSCGVCGKTSIEAVTTKTNFPITSTSIKVSKETIYELPEKLSANQNIFTNTGGIHATALFDFEGKFIDSKEDVGRHNAMDKVIGQAIQNDQIPLDDKIMLVSGRASFELIQKASMAGIPVIVAVGAPSTLAQELAEQCNITLIGFAKSNSFNIYSHPNRII